MRSKFEEEEKGIIVKALKSQGEKVSSSEVKHKSQKCFLTIVFLFVPKKKTKIVDNLNCPPFPLS